MAMIYSHCLIFFVYQNVPHSSQCSTYISSLHFHLNQRKGPHILRGDVVIRKIKQQLNASFQQYK